MRAHARSNIHIQSCEAEIVAARQGTISQQLQHISEEEKVKNSVAVKALLRCTHFLTKHHIPHTTNFDQLVDLVVSCGGEHLKNLWRELEKMQHTHLKKLLLNSLRQLANGLRSACCSYSPHICV